MFVPPPELSVAICLVIVGFEVTRVIGTIVLAWVVTIPVGATLAIFFYYFYKGLLDSLGAT